MTPELLVVLPFLFLGAAFYSSVGHGGATVYLAILALAGFALDPLITSVLVLNLLVAGVAFVVFRQAGHLRWGLLLPFVVTGVPFAYLGGRMILADDVRGWLLGGALALAALRLFLVSRPLPERVMSVRARWVFAPAIGAGLGFLAGAVGIGGGIFLSPVLVLFGWADVKQAGAVASGYIALNSLAGLAARLPRTPLDPTFLATVAVVVVAGAAAGAFLGAARVPKRTLNVVLGAVLVVAAVKTFLA
ncbi:MAG: sulfite exporter TauE/SafE family protein [Euryarchaeota archaeon]|nr:sulfite exporter TauE/SafE family protein [Euryarchaeota archaeon]